MNFRKYIHIERFGTVEVEGIELGNVYVQSKIDGSNASVWLSDEGEIQAGSRNRHLSLEKDNLGFLEWALKQEKIKSYLAKFPHHRLFGEWLRPHSLRTYREEAWNKFYVFDISVDTGEGIEFVPYNSYKEGLDEFGLDYIPVVSIIQNGGLENFVKLVESNTFLIKENSGVGEGIVLKNYDFHNRYGRQTWAKIVRNEFKDENVKAFGARKVEISLLEQEIVDKYCTETLIDKTYSKIVSDSDGWQSKYIPRLFGTVYHDFVVEETWNIIKEYKEPRICFKTVKHLVINKIKSHRKDLF